MIFIVTAFPLWVQGYLFEKRYGALTRQSQDQAGDLATAVEESVHGIRVLKAFGRGKHALRNFARRAEHLRETELDKARAIGVDLVLARADAGCRLRAVPRRRASG